MRIEATLCAVLLVVEVVVAEPCCGRHHHHRGGGALVAGGLGFVGGFVAGRFSGRHHGGCCGRKRRDIQTFLQDPKIIETYKEIAEDKDQCGKRLVCELAQREFEELVDDEEQILQPYRGDGISDGTIYGDYDEAAWHGQEGHSCPDNYPLCAFTATQVMGEYRKYSADNQLHS